MRFFSQFTICSGGQTGVDQGALDAAISLGIPHGGWCPKGRITEDGPLPRKYYLREHVSSKYAPRTKQNIIDSDGTLILTYGATVWSSPGTRLTSRYVFELKKPNLNINLSQVYAEMQAKEDPTQIFPASQEVLDWINKEGIMILNVAGPREIHEKGIQYKSSLFLACTFYKYKNRGIA